MATDKKIWGVPVAVSLAGRTNWPNKVKTMAVKKVLDDGARLADLAVEIGAHENLIRKWCNQERRARGESVCAQEPFASVTIASESIATPISPQMCKLHVGDATLEFPIDAPAESLQALVYALRCSL